MHANYRVLGGEDVSHRTEAAFLESSGYTVKSYTVDNADFADRNAVRSLLDMTFNSKVFHNVRRIIDSFEPDLVYVNNTYPALSPSAIVAAKSKKIPVIQVLRNYRKGCIAGTTFRQGQDCQLCVGKKVPLDGVRYSCYRGSKLASGAATLSKVIQEGARIHNVADLYIAVSEHVKTIATSSGVESRRILVRPNLVWPDPAASNDIGRGDRTSFVFVGRDSHDKGLHVLLDAISQIPNRDLRLEVYGCGRPAAFDDGRVEFHGAVPPSAIAPALAKALSVVVPSIWPEPFGRVVIEALASGAPVIASKVGGMADFKGPGVTLVHPDDPQDLARAINSTLANAADEQRKQSQAARKYYERQFAPERWLESTAAIFDRALALTPTDTMGTRTDESMSPGPDVDTEDLK
jgi:glycosyltransferase involved in cell wall biosynthesis